MSTRTEPRAADDTPAETLAYWAYRTAQWLAVTLPERAGRTLFEGLGRLAYHLSTEAQRNVRANLARILGRPPEDALVRASAIEAFELYARYWFDTFRIAALPSHELDARTEVTGLDHLERAVADGRGCVIVLGHLGNWDAAGSWVARRGFRVVSVNERLRPERLFRLFVRHREDFGVPVFALGDADLTARLSAHLADNGIVALIADRAIGGRGIEVEMFGAPRRIPAGPAKLALDAGAPLLFAAVSTTDRGCRLRIGSPIEAPRTGDARADVRAMTQRLADEMTRAIAARPADWHVLQPGWPDA
ncbi:MAG: phosphatidylinositol mannoside acyltransferase [Actinomycetota bacterium]